MPRHARRAEQSREREQAPEAAKGQRGWGEYHRHTCRLHTGLLRRTNKTHTKDTPATRAGCLWGATATLSWLHSATQLGGNGAVRHPSCWPPTHSNLWATMAGGWHKRDRGCAGLAGLSPGVPFQRSLLRPAAVAPPPASGRSRLLRHASSGRGTTRTPIDLHVPCGRPHSR